MYDKINTKFNHEDDENKITYPQCKSLRKGGTGVSKVRRQIDQFKDEKVNDNLKMIRSIFFPLPYSCTFIVFGGSPPPFVKKKKKNPSNGGRRVLQNG